MPHYKYKAYDRQGRVIESEIDGESASAVSKSLNDNGYTPVSVSLAKTAGPLPSERGGWFSPRVKLEDINIFTRQLWTLQRAGLPLQSSLIALREQVRSKAFRQVISQIIQDLEGGRSFSLALARHPKVFHPFYVNMVKAGEVSGKLDEILIHLAEMGQFELLTKEKIKSATRYPLITLLSIVVAFIIVVTFVIPKFSAVFGQAKATLPLPTRILLGVNYTVRHEWPILILVVVALVFLFRYLLSTSWGRYQWDRFTIKVPVIGPLVFNLVMSRFSRILSELLSSGLPILQSLQLVSETLDNAVIARAVVEVQKSVNEGKGMAEPMRQSRLFLPMVIQMVSVGEQSGKTDELLRHVADYYGDQADLMIKNLTTLIEPILILFLGGMVLILALGVFLPMWNMGSVLH